jgi:hypothetical protein
LLLVGLIYIFVGSSVFKISAITVVSAEPVDEAKLISILKAQVAARPTAGWLGVDSYFSWPLDLQYTAPNISTITIEKSYWNKTITVTVVPRQRYAVWCSSETSCAWVDTTGVLFQPAPIAEGQLVQTIFENGTSSVGAIGDFVLSSSSFDVVKKVIDSTKSINLSISRVLVDRELQELHLTTASGALIMLSLRFDPTSTALPAIRRFAEKPGYTNIDYLNLTVENRAYVKYR